jgi:hypothetical protein
MRGNFGRLSIVLTILVVLLAPTAAYAGNGAQGKGPTLEQLRRGLGPGGMQVAPQTHASSEYPVVASGLDNPRGLTFASNGRLLVAEAGRGGDNCFNPDPGDPSFVMCAGHTGAITAVDTRRGAAGRIVTGLPSLAGPEGSEATGPHDVATRGSSIYTLTGLGAPPEVREMFGPPLTDMGWLWRVSFDNNKQKLVDVSAYEATANPDGGPIDSNPYSLVNLGGQRFAVVDAGGNSLLLVNAATGAISTLAVFPSRVVPVDPRAQEAFGLPPQMPAESVPNSVAVGPDGALYVGELLGFPFTAGESRVYRVAPGQAPAVFAEGFSSIIDIAFGSDGNLYVLEIAKGGLIEAFLGGDFTGALIRVDGQGNRTEIASEGLTAPGGVAINAAGEIYVTNNSIFPALGEVLKIR